MQEILALPLWELECWKAVFMLYGPLCWKRNDYLIARVNQYQGIGDDALNEYLLFKDPSEKEPVRTEEEVLASLGWRQE